ncbi:type II secretion system F family protein [Glutamicibacter sp. TV12E]|uniref:type II secretion system F family protein n=1 Tax=Glutamicibacter sp. TV12E TaxID=3446362 RepID=UPI0040340EE6
MLILVLSAAALWLWLPAISGEASLSTKNWMMWRGFSRHNHEPMHTLNDDARIIRELSALLRSGLGFYPALDALLEVENGTGHIVQALKDLRAIHRLNNQNRYDDTKGEILPEHAAVQRLHWCLQISQRSGATLAEVLERLAEDLESASVAQQSFDAAMAGPRATRKLLTWLPLVGFGFGLLVGIDVLGTLLSSWAAQLSVAIGAALWIANRVWCQRLMHSTSAQALS